MGALKYFDGICIHKDAYFNYNLVWRTSTSIKASNKAFEIISKTQWKWKKDKIWMNIHTEWLKEQLFSYQKESEIKKCYLSPNL